MGGDRYAAGSRLRGWRSEGGAIALELAGATAEVSLGPEGSVRLRAAAGASLPPDPAPAVGRTPWKAVPAEARAAGGGGLRIGCEGALETSQVELDADPFALRVRSGGVLLAELTSLLLAEDGGARIDVDAAPGERFFGFGEKRGPLDKRGARLEMRNRDPELRDGDPLYLSVPFFLSLQHGEGSRAARGVLLDGFAPSRFDVAAGRADTVRLETVAGGIDLTVFPGPRPRDVLRRFTAVVGRHPLPPLWALGHHQSRWSYGSERQVRRVAEQIRSRHIPTDVIHLDIDYMDGFRVFTWHPRRFPRPRALISELAERGFRVICIVDPGVKRDEGYAVYRSGLERDAFCRNADGSLPELRVWPGPAALPDFNRSDVRDWWGEQHGPLLEAGVAGIWNDMNEPAGWGRELRIGRQPIPLSRQDLSDALQCDPADESRRVPHEQVRNLYGHQECRATRAALEAARPGQRPFVLTRSGGAGTQRYAAVWTGDVRSRWPDLRESVPMLLNLSLSGIPFCGADIGGFFGSCTPELFARWMQLGALYPFARTHSVWMSRRQEPWRFGRRVEAIARRALELRMRLLPYLYGLFREAEQTGAPVWRPLFYEFPEEPEAAAVEDQVMLGHALMLAPVLERGARAREVFLPPGVWFCWDTGARYAGPRRLRVEAPLERLPLFARGGSIVPTQSAVEHVGAAPAEPCVLEVFPGADASAELVEDDGESTDYRTGGLARTGLRLWDRAGGRLRLEIDRREGRFELPARRVRVAVHGCVRPTTVTLDGAPLRAGGGVPGYSAADGLVHVRFVDEGRGQSLEVDPAP